MMTIFVVHSVIYLEILDSTAIPLMSFIILS